MTAFKAKVKAVYPDTCCFHLAVSGVWMVCKSNTGTHLLGSSKTAFLAWVDAWRNIEAKNS